MGFGLHCGIYTEVSRIYASASSSSPIQSVKSSDRSPSLQTKPCSSPSLSPSTPLFSPSPSTAFSFGGTRLRCLILVTSCVASVQITVANGSAPAPVVVERESRFVLVFLSRDAWPPTPSIFSRTVNYLSNKSIQGSTLHLPIYNNAFSRKTEYREVMRRLGDCARATFLEFKRAIHPLTNYVMNYLMALTDFSQTLDSLLMEHEDVEDLTIPPSPQDPLFPGKNVVHHQLDLMTDFLGTPPPESISRQRKKQPVPFSHKFSKADPLALRLLERLLAFDPKDRASAEDALSDPYFSGLSNSEREPSTQPISKLEFDFERKKLTNDDILEYHPQMLEEYKHGGDQLSFMYPRLASIFIEHILFKQ
ncbi:hypothetical protein HID58_021356 [Brassica napus]|uniref:Exocyst complex subunit Exo70 C-terminal domain-containing protein n=1 Tax=Brassica napus TaxID=3708 RepID=A0ABQ8CXQ7_BRANA|nr:hypothetical protein HID58_021356 [Brassica napus]